MSDDNTHIIQRFEEFGKQLCGDKHGWKKCFAEKLGITSQQLNNMLSGSVGIGGKMQSRLRDLSCDIDWLMTGKTKDDLPAKRDTLISYSGTPTPEMKKRIERLAEWMSNASEEDGKMLEQVARKILKGDA